jgi:hypothetical protein
MTPKILLLLGLSLFFAACDKETDLLNQVDRPFSTALSDTDPDSPISQTDLLRGDTCIELKTTHWLIGNWNFQQVSLSSLELSHVNTQIAKRYIIAASGDAMSPEYARGFSQLDLQYDLYRNGSHKITGTMVTQFYYGEIMEMTFDCHAKLGNGEQSGFLQGPVQEARLTTEAEVLGLTDGKIFFNLVFSTDNNLRIDIQTTSLLCIK